MNRNVWGLVLPLLIVLALAGAGCGKATAGAGPAGPATTAASSNEVDMTSNNFAQHAITITAGQTVHFVDPMATGALHILCLGHDQVCSASAQGPQVLKGSGLTFNPGQTKDIAFPTPGTYAITCTIHPNMNLTVTVQP